MTITELQILLDLDRKSKRSILEKYAKKINLGFFFIDSDDGQCYLFDGHGNLDDVSKVKTIDEGCIPKDIVKIVIPNGVAYIGEWTFYDCSRLMSVAISDSVVDIGGMVFQDCIGLESVTIPDSVTNIGYVAFCGCINLKELVFKGKSLKEVKAMEDYPWGVKDKSIIKCN